MCTSRSFGRPVTMLEELREAVALFTSRSAEKARAQHTAASILTVLIQTNHFRKREPQCSRHATITLSRPTHDTLELVDAAHSVVSRIFQDGFSYHKAGVILGNFVTDSLHQAELFDAPPDPRRETLMATLDTINWRFGRDTIRPLGTGTRQAWRMKQAHRSQRYTTRWSELARVR